MVILGIDPALQKLGWGVIVCSGSKINYLGSGVVTTKNDTEMPRRLAFITDELDNIISNFKPNIVAMEETFINNNATSSLKLGYVRGAVMALIGRHSLDFKEFAPNKIKKTLVGTGHAEKEQILHMIKLLMPQANISRLDEADALAVAYTCSAYNSSRH